MYLKVHVTHESLDFFKYWTWSVSNSILIISVLFFLFADICEISQRWINTENCLWLMRTSRVRGQSHTKFEEWTFSYTPTEIFNFQLAKPDQDYQKATFWGDKASWRKSWDRVFLSPGTLRSLRNRGDWVWLKPGTQLLRDTQKVIRVMIHSVVLTPSCVSGSTVYSSDALRTISSQWRP